MGQDTFISSYALPGGKTSSLSDQEHGGPFSDSQNYRAIEGCGGGGGSFLGTKESLFIDQGNRNLLPEFLRRKNRDAPLLPTLSSEVITSEKSSLNLWIELMCLFGF